MAQDIEKVNGETVETEETTNTAVVTKNSDVPAQKPKKTKKKSNKPPFGSGIKRFFKEMGSELKKVKWPDAKTTFKNTGIVLAVVVIFSLLTFGVDALFSFLLGLLAK